MRVALVLLSLFSGAAALLAQPALASSRLAVHSGLQTDLAADRRGRRAPDAATRERAASCARRFTRAISLA